MFYNKNARRRSGGALRSFAVVQTLEQRRLLAFADLTSSGTLLVNGTAAADTIKVSQDDVNVVVEVDGAAFNFTRASVHRIYLDAGAGDDTVTITAKHRATLLGGEGNDKLVGGPYADFLDGQGGDDTLNGEGANDTLNGGAGKDVMEYGDRTIGFNFDVGQVQNAVYPVVARSSDGAEEDDAKDYFETVAATNQNDTFTPLVGQGKLLPYAITLIGRGGDDVFKGGGGELPLTEIGGPGKDYFGGYTGGAAANKSPTVLGGPGNDSFELAAAWGYTDGGSGADSMVGTSTRALGFVDLNQYRDVENAIGATGDVIGNAQNNYITFAQMDNAPSKTLVANGNGGNDTIVGSEFNDSLSGGDGDDVISGAIGRDKIYGGEGNDALNGNGGDDRIYGGNGNDTLVGSGGRDALYGEAGGDLFMCRDKHIDTLVGGSGDDPAKLDHLEVNDVYREIEKLI
ncbi:MAG TPA: calcium-binding protein [Tepidisphaeraceae bacterium]|jgi:Ca2+-binding RTX toxin-like protein